MVHRFHLVTPVRRRASIRLQTAPPSNHPLPAQSISPRRLAASTSAFQCAFSDRARLVDASTSPERTSAASSNDAQFGRHGSIDRGCIDLQDTATRWIDEATSVRWGRSSSTFYSPRERPIGNDAPGQRISSYAKETFSLSRQIETPTQVCSEGADARSVDT